MMLPMPQEQGFFQTITESVSGANGNVDLGVSSDDYMILSIKSDTRPNNAGFYPLLFATKSGSTDHHWYAKCRYAAGDSPVENGTSITFECYIIPIN